MTSIGSEAFEKCTSLKKIKIPEGVTTINSYTFYKCTSLEEITIPAGLTKINRYVFEGCAIKRVNISDLKAWFNINFNDRNCNPMNVGADLYLNDEKVTDLVVPEGVTQINNFAFYHCTSLNSVKITEGVTSIGESAFQWCTNLKSVTIPDSVTTLYYGAFYACTSLEKVIGGNGLKNIFSSVFYYCTSLTDITLPETLGNIYGYAFHRCDSLEKLFIPDSVAYIGSEAFGEDPKLTVSYNCTNSAVANYINSDQDSNDYVQTMNPIHSSIEKADAQKPTCTEAGWDAYETCSACGYSSKKEIPATGHTWNDGEVTKPATCTEDGEMKYTCTVCKETYEEVIPAAHTLKHVEAKAVTCTEAGWEAYEYCENCDYTTKVEIPATGHDYQSEITKEATCTEDGEKTYTCSNCKDTYKETIPATGHSLKRVEAKEPTCIEAGWEAYEYCENCDYTTKVEIPADPENGHSWSQSYTVDKAATAYSQGSKTFHCVICDAKNEENKIVIPAIGKVTASTATYAYNGSVQKPDVTISDADGNAIDSSNYEVIYSNESSKKVGAYTIKVKFGNEYAGTKTFTYKINPKPTTIKSVTKGTKAFTVKWKKKTAQTTGYQIRYSKNSSMYSSKTVTVSGNTTVSKKVSSLKAATKYYVQVRTYKTVDGTKYYSTWSTRKVVKTK